MDLISDEALYAKIRKGDADAFDALYRRFEKRLFQFIYGYVRNQQEAEEIFHDSFVEVMTGRELRFEEASFCAWIFRVARNRSLNRLRSWQRGHAAQERAPEPEAVPAPESLLEGHQLLSRLNQVVARLPEQLAEIYRLRCLELSYQQMAEVLGIPLGTVKSRTHELINQVKEGIQP